MGVALNNEILADLPEGVAGPEYDRAALSPGILHIGVGNFHRAHMGWYLDRLFGLGEGHDWAIVGAGIKPFDAARREALQAQDWLTTVVELDPGALNARVTGAMVDFCEIDGAALVARMVDPAIRIVSLTVTEFLLLQALAQRPGFVKSRDQLMDVAYDDQVYVDDRTIDSHIKRLRKKMRTADDDFSAIETLYGIGYRYNEE